MSAFTLTRTREQRYAADTYERVDRYKQGHLANRVAQQQYGGMAHKLPILIRAAGLAQALAFVAARKKAPLDQLLDDLAATVGHADRAALLSASRGQGTPSLAAYMTLTREVLTALLWYKRYAQALLDIKDAGALDASGEGVGT